MPVKWRLPLVEEFTERYFERHLMPVFVQPRQLDSFPANVPLSVSRRTGAGLVEALLGHQHRELLSV